MLRVHSTVKKSSLYFSEIDFAMGNVNVGIMIETQNLFVELWSSCVFIYVYLYIFIQNCK